MPDRSQSMHEHAKKTDPQRDYQPFVTSEKVKNVNIYYRQSEKLLDIRKGIFYKWINHKYRKKF